MASYIKLFVLALSLSALMAGSASASTVNFSPGGNIASASLGKITFTGGAINLRCNLTLSGSLVTSASATAGTRVGAISRYEVASCEGGTIRSINSLPYELTFVRILFSGGTVVGIEVNVPRIDITVSVTIFGIVVDCTYAGTVPHLISITSGLTGLVIKLFNTLAKKLGGGSCPASGSMSGTFGLSPQQRVTLI